MMAQKHSSVINQGFEFFSGASNSGSAAARPNLW
jgi:hypothetical protein